MSSPRAGTAYARRADRAASDHPSRLPFVLLVVGLLAAGLVCLLVVNTTLATGAIRINDLAQANATSTQRLQQLRQLIAAEQSASVIEREALALGMRTDTQLTFLNLSGPRGVGQPDRAVLAGARGAPAPGFSRILMSAASHRHRARRHVT